MHDFGYVALNMKYVNPEDSGTYTCRATNELGEAVTSATLFVQCKYAVVIRPCLFSHQAKIFSTQLSVLHFIHFLAIFPPAWFYSPLPYLLVQYTAEIFARGFLPFWGSFARSIFVF